MVVLRGVLGKLLFELLPDQCIAFYLPKELKRLGCCMDKAGLHEHPDDCERKNSLYHPTGLAYWQREEAFY